MILSAIFGLTMLVCGLLVPAHLRAVDANVLKLAGKNSHSVVEAIAKGTPVGFRPAKKTDTLTVRFEPSDLQQIREEANQRGVGPTTLVRMWVREHLRRTGEHSGKSEPPSENLPQGH